MITIKGFLKNGKRVYFEKPIKTTFYGASQLFLLLKKNHKKKIELIIK